MSLEMIQISKQKAILTHVKRIYLKGSQSLKLKIF